jgi:hypothetical protein
MDITPKKEIKMSTSLTYPARPSNGRLWLALLGIFVVIILVMPLFLGAGIKEFTNPGLLLSLTLGGIIGGGALLLAVLFPTMRYTLDSDALLVRFGPWELYRIPYTDIQKISWQNLSPTLWSSFRLPGFAMFSVPYGNNVGTIKMCASACANHILVIRARRALYGITPADEEQFVTALMARVKG